ncbi:toxin-activating lysine-acyltransferase [Zoogloea sp.]|uniref:toxin-activating lysine-acyltransferase n=1 Tax=Zoogloea sp. TaxID=49181 RepID=UPI001D75D18E|nr:toxin-activating lysine-acyltransferase [Zoogloea sp.]MBK6654837.1 toxin-activating lysine-acyltransferase [Zoogloea sp.]
MTNQSPEKSTNEQELSNLVRMAQEQAKVVLRKLPLLGPMTWLMLQRGGTRNILLSELEWRVLPALALDQVRLHMREEAPIAFITWAKLSAAAAGRYREPPHQLSPSDWKSGEDVWIIDVIAPFGGAAEAIQDLKEKVFPGQVLRQLSPSPEGLAKVLKW